MTTKLFYEIKPIKESLWRKMRRKNPKANWSTLHSLFCDAAGKFNSCSEYTPKMVIIRYSYDELIRLCAGMK